MPREFVLIDQDGQISLDEPRFDSTGSIDSYNVRLSGDGFSAALRIDHSLVFQHLPDYLGELAEAWRGWEGEKQWRSTDADFRLVATCDARGHVTLKATVRPDTAVAPWQASTSVSVEAGQLDQILSRAQRFFAHES